jgi:hypothetical protein
MRDGIRHQLGNPGRRVARKARRLKKSCYATHEGPLPASVIGFPEVVGLQQFAESITDFDTPSQVVASAAVPRENAKGHPAKLQVLASGLPEFL